MNWRFWERERQDNPPAQQQDLNQLLSQFLLSEAQGPVRRADFEATLAFEAAVGVLQRSMAAAKVEGSDYFNPCMLSAIVRDIALRGESVWWLSPMPYRVGYYDLDGKFDRESWLYKLYLPGPSDTMVKAENQTYKNCLHIIYQSHPLRPWRGISPLAKTFGQQALANLEKSLGEESSTSTGYVLPAPLEGLNDANKEALKTQLPKLRGKLLVSETMRGNWGTGDRREAPKDWQTNRLGPMIPESSIKAHDSLSKEIFAALGVPLALSAKQSDANMRTAMRVFISTTLIPIAKIIADAWEFSTGEKITFNFDSLRTADEAAARARAFGIFVKGGMGIEEAVIKSGLMADND